jgi:hypothetical protein
MKKSRFAETQIVSILKEADAGRVCAETGMRPLFRTCSANPGATTRQAYWKRLYFATDRTRVMQHPSTVQQYDY